MKVTREQFLKNLETPSGIVDAVLDTDTFNEIDDQFALAYMLTSPERIRVCGLTAAPFSGTGGVSDPREGMERSYDEILHILRLAGREELPVKRGAGTYLPDEQTPVNTEASAFLVNLAKKHSPENPLYIVGIGACTNIASAILTDPTICENIVIVWLGGHAWHMPLTDEFNMKQDIAASRVLFACPAPLVQLPCAGVVHAFATSRWELEHWLKGQNPLCDYLVARTIQAAESRNPDRPWTRVIWDVTAIAWLLNDNRRFLFNRVENAPAPGYDRVYDFSGKGKPMKYVFYVERDRLFGDLFAKLRGTGQAKS